MNSTIGVLAGIIVGAIGMEMMKKNNPELVDKLENKMAETAQSIKNSFGKKETVEEASSPETA